MTIYPIGDFECKIDFDNFLCLVIKGDKKYKSDFSDLSVLYEYIDRNITDITYLLFNNNEYFLKNGVLHNLYGAGHVRINDKEDAFYPIGHKSLRFYIDGKLVYMKPGVHCKKLENFQKQEIFFYEELTNKKPGKDKNGKFYRRKEGIDYITTIINLDERIKFDQRNNKIKELIKELK